MKEIKRSGVGVVFTIVAWLGFVLAGIGAFMLFNGRSGEATLGQNLLIAGLSGGLSCLAVGSSLDYLAEIAQRLAIIEVAVQSNRPPENLPADDQNP